MQIGYERSLAEETYKQQPEWYGNCFGMSVSSVLFYKNILKEERYNSLGYSYPHEFDKPNTDDKYEKKLREMIELFQVSQFLPLQGWTFDRVSFRNAIIVQLDSGNPVTLGLKDGKVGHMVVIYGYTQLNDVYVFNIYDCSGYVTSLWYKNENEWRFNYYDDKYDWIPTNIIPYSWMRETYEKLYEINDNAISLFSTRSEPTYTYIFHPAENMTITNSSGQIIEIADGEVITDIEEVSLIPSSYLAKEPRYTIILPTDTYTIVGTSDEVVEIAAADDFMSVGITAKSSTPVTISSDLNDITVNNETEADYSIRYTTYDNTFDEMVLSGIADGEITASLNVNEVTLTGAKNVSASATVSETETVAESELGQNQTCTVKCSEETDGNANLQILSDDVPLTEAASLAQREQVAVPEYDLESGEYTEVQYLTFTKDDDTIIYYTTDGTIPSKDNGSIYSSSLEINQSMSIKAIATKYGYTDSDVIELDYTLPFVIMPEASHTSGNYDEVITVELTAYEDDTEIYYRSYTVKGESHNT